MKLYRVKDFDFFKREKLSKEVKKEIKRELDGQNIEIVDNPAGPGFTLQMHQPERLKEYLQTTKIWNEVEQPNVK